MAQINTTTVNDEAEMEAAAAFQSSQVSQPVQPNPVLAQATKTASKRSVSPPPESLPVVTIDQATSDPLTAVTAAIDEGRVKAIEQVKKVEQAKITEGGLQELVATTVTELGKQKQVVAVQAGLATLKAEQLKRDLSEARGNDPKRIAELVSARKAAVDDMLEKQARVSENVNVQFGDDPLQWIANKVTLADTVEEANVAEATVAKYDTALAGLTTLANNTNRTIDQLKATQTDATVAATSKGIALEATQAATEAQIKASKTNAEAATFVLNASNQDVDRIAQQYSLKVQERMRLAGEEERAIRLSQLEKEADFEDTFFSAFVKGEEKLGNDTSYLADPAALAEKKKEVITAYNVKGEARDKVIASFNVGTGARPLTAAELYNAVGKANPTWLTDGSNRALTFLQDTVDTANVQLAATTKGKITTEVHNDAVNKQAEANWVVANNAIKSGDFDNPNHAVPMSELLTKEGLKEDPFVKEMLLPLMVGDIKDIAAEKILQLGAASIKTKSNPEGKFKFEKVATTITNIYKRAATLNNTMQRRVELDLPIQEQYNAKLKGIGFAFYNISLGKLFKSGTVDLTDGAMVRHSLVTLITGTTGKKLTGIFNDPENPNYVTELPDVYKPAGGTE